MGFVGGMIICFIGGYLNSFLYSYHLRKKHRGFLFWFAVLFLIAVITLDYLIFINIVDARQFNIIPWIEVPKDIPDSQVGKYWMFTPGNMIGMPQDLGVDSFNGPGWDILAMIFFISYIWWFTIGQNLGRFMFGRRSYEKGAWYLLRSTKMLKKSMEKLEKKHTE